MPLLSCVFFSSMRPRFERSLHDYSDIAKEEAQQELQPAPEQAPEDITHLGHVLDWHLERAAEAALTPKEAQRDVYDIQKQKQAIMRALKDDLRTLDDPEAAWEIPNGARVVTREGDRYVWVAEDGTQHEASLGDLITDGEWGVRYYLDPVTAPRADRKRHRVADARRDIADLLDEQIVTEEYQTRSKHRADAAGGILRAHRRVLQGADLQVGDSGKIAEILVQNVLTKFMIDRGSDVVIERADVYQDAVQMIDFIVKRRAHRRGAQVEEMPTLRRVGIQFTLQAWGQKLQQKIKSLEATKGDIIEAMREHDRIDDIVFIRMRIPDLVQQYTAWIAAGRPPGGPAKEWQRAHEEELVAGVLQRMEEHAGLASLGEDHRRSSQERSEQQQPKAHEARAARPAESVLSRAERVEAAAALVTRAKLADMSAQSIRALLMEYARVLSSHAKFGKGRYQKHRALRAMAAGTQALPASAEELRTIRDRIAAYAGIYVRERSDRALEQAQRTDASVSGPPMADAA